MAQSGIDRVENYWCCCIWTLLHSGRDGSDEKNFLEFGNVVPIVNVRLVVLLESFKNPWFFTLRKFRLRYCQYVCASRKGSCQSYTFVQNRACDSNSWRHPRRLL